MAAGLLSCFLGVVLIAMTDAAVIEHTVRKVTDCDSEVYCTGDLLKTVQLAEIFNDSKTFVDLYQVNDPQITLANFHNLMKSTQNNPSRNQIKQFVSENFESVNELLNWTLPDWTDNPTVLSRILDSKYREWARHLNQIWKDLARKMNPNVKEHPERHSLIYVENGFIIPGGRFKEFYYWDSYWVIEGLLLSDMYQTAKGMIDNFVYMVERYGFIPNGGRIYYLMRSQPPLLHLMVSRYLEFTDDILYLRKIIPLLEKEFSFWQQEKTINVVKNGKTYKMGHYVVNSTRPRPESYKEDYRLAQLLPEKSRDFFYNNIKAGAESGWDFSNRWCIGNNKTGMLSLLNISTQYIIPVDLNAILQQNARLLGEFHTLLGNNAKAQYYAKIASEFQMAIDNVLWNAEEGIWMDYDVQNEEPRRAFYPSNLTPLYTRSYNRQQREQYALSAVKYLKSQNIDHFFGGTPTSLKQTGEQWDFPNAWPPLQSFIVMGLYWTGVTEAMDSAHELAQRWLASNYIGFMETGHMFEKYDSIDPGRGGGGGEYNVQTGFGWSNGVVLEFLNTFPAISLEQS
ncbi:trehalase-like isoform X1 [Ceratina calcarata]|uniref:Trehalase n=1 Tax=Ceratina calcarata TaxID=156304 RepID=A0AAJ7J0N5_9HYME|nr:trehalase-like isoform X1 [Ceratina calcarata]XP_017881926.1 trehalase-like isoform X1 [Ceratina calcarata]